MKQFITFTILVGLILSVCSSQPSYSYNRKHTINVNITDIVDGDTVGINLKQGRYKVRLTAIDCRESKDNHRVQKQMQDNNLTKEQVLEPGNLATTILKDKLAIAHNKGKLEIIGIDKYSRIVGYLYLKKNIFTYYSINDFMLTTGYCSPYIYQVKNK